MSSPVLSAIVEEHVKAALAAVEQMPAVDWQPLDAVHLVKALAILRELAARLPQAAGAEAADLDRGLEHAYLELDKVRLFQWRASQRDVADSLAEALRHIRQAREALQ